MTDKIKRWTAGKDESCPITCEILDSRTQRTIANNPKISESSDFLQTNTMVRISLSYRHTIESVEDESTQVHGG